MQIQTNGALRLGLIAALTVSVAACASKPKPAYEPDVPVTQAPQNTSPPTQPNVPAPTGPISSAPLPGSVQDFVVNVGDRVYFDFDSFDLRAFHDAIWKNGNVPLSLIRWELLGLRDDIDRIDRAAADRPGPPSRP